MRAVYPSVAKRFTPALPQRGAGCDEAEDHQDPHGLTFPSIDLMFAQKPPSRAVL